MTRRLNYRFSPFHLVSLWFLYQVIIGFRLNAKLGDKAELGALLPFVYLALLFGTLLVDFLIQFIISKTSMGGWKMIWITQILLLIAFGVFQMQTVYYSE